jgi:hypothetical protein
MSYRPDERQTDNDRRSDSAHSRLKWELTALSGALSTGLIVILET